MNVNPAFLQKGHRVLEYEIVDQLGQGGQGVVYRVRRAGVDYALKIPLYKIGELPEEEQKAVERADREVATLKSVRHPNILRVVSYEWWPDPQKGWPIIVTEFVEGLPLRKWLESHPSLRSIVDVFARLADALHEMHRLEIFHRDLKAENVIVRPNGEPVILDFGVAKPKSAYTQTKIDTFVGTYEQLSPEFARWYLSGAFERGEWFVYRAPSDMHALGYVLYQALTGRRPFRATSSHLMALLMEIQDVVPTAPSVVNPQVPAPLGELVMRLLDKNPAARPSGRDVADELAQLPPGDAQSWSAPFTPPPSGQTVSERARDSLLDVLPSKDDEPAPSPAGKPARNDGPALDRAESSEQAFRPPTVPGRAVEVRADANAPPLPERREPTANISSVRRQLERWSQQSRSRAPLYVGLGVAAVVGLALGLAAIGQRTEAPKPRSLLAEVDKQEQSGSASSSARASLAPVEASSSPQPATATRVSGARTPKNVDEEKIDQLLLEKYGGRPTLPPKTAATAIGPLPPWLNRATSLPAEEKSEPERKSFGVPLGAHIPVRLFSNLDSRMCSDGPVEAKLVRAFVVRGTVVLPSQTVVYGKCQSHSAGRFVVRFSRLRLPDNSDAKLVALAMDREDGKPGLPGRRIRSAPAHRADLGGKVAKQSAAILLNQVSGGLTEELAQNAGRAALEEGPREGDRFAGDVLLLDAGYDFELFAEEAF